jgi:5-methyltetrahydropteroyltriglutamate--homocysteine methyltransferase
VRVVASETLGKRPRFRADHVGSLIRTEAIKSARKRHFEEGTLDAAGLEAIEDAEIAEIVRMQQDAGLPVVTDGEFRRSFWHYDFLSALIGFELEERDHGIRLQGTTLRPRFPRITGRLDFPDDHPMLGQFRFLASVARAVPKIAIPGPSCCHFRTEPRDIAPPEYADPDVLFADLAATYAKAVRAFYDAGCRYLQFDDIFFAYLCDETIGEQKRAEGIDPDWLIERYAWATDEAIADRPADMTIGLHLCRGNFKSTWVAKGGHDPAADAIFNQVDADIYLLECDSEREGGLAPLRLLPKGPKRVLPGFVATASAELEHPDALRRKFEQAAKYVDLDQLGIAPQCGFASTEESRRIGEDDQRRKLELLVSTAEAIWGRVDA